jgi:perosamine synthetase
MTTSAPLSTSPLSTSPLSTSPLSTSPLSTPPGATTLAPPASAPPTGVPVPGTSPSSATAGIPFTRVVISEEAREAAAQVLGGGWVTTGPEVVEFEREFAGLVGATYAVAVASCTAAIELALRALHLPPGAKVLTSTNTFCGVAHAIVHAGHHPVLVDVDPATMMPNPATTSEAARRAGGVDAMVVIHYAGHPAPVAELAEAAGLPLFRVVEDAAHGPCIRIGDRPVGAVSAATCFSFNPTKNLPIGAGGLLTTDDPDLADQVRRERLHGMSNDAWRRYLPGSGWRYGVESDGIKANMTDLQAAIGRAQLRQLPAWQARRAELAQRYSAGLAGVPGVRTPEPPGRGSHSWHLYVIQVGERYGRSRDELITLLAEQGVSCSVHFIPLHHHDFYRGLAPAGELPAADGLFHRVLSLPFYPSLTDDEVDLVCERVRAAASPGGGNGRPAHHAGGSQQSVGSEGYVGQEGGGEQHHEA